MLGGAWIKLCALGLVVAGSISMVGRHLAPGALEQATQQFNEHASGNAELETLEYETGYVSSRALSRFTSGSKTFLIEHRIEHAPWTPIQRAAAVRVTSWVWKEKGGNEAPIAELRTRILLPDRVYAEFSVTPQATENARAAGWESFTGSFESKGNRHHGEVEIRKIEAGGGAMRMGKARLGADVEVRGEEVRLLGFSSRFEGLVGPDGDAERLDFSMAERSEGDLLGYDFRFDVRGMTTPEGSMDEMVVDVSIENVPSDIRAAFTSGAEAPMADWMPLLQKALLRSPSLKVRELRMKGRQEGTPLDLSVRGSVSFDGAGLAADASPAELLECVDADLTLSLGEEALAEVLRNPFGGKAPGLPNAQAVLQQLVQAGYFERKGDSLEARLQVHGTQHATLNGQPIDQAVRQFASLTADKPVRTSSPSPARPSARPLHERANNPELDEMRRQMGLK